MNVSQQILIAIIALWIGSWKVEVQIDYWPIEHRGKRAIGNHAEHLHDLGTHGINTFLLLSHRYAMLSNKTKCWVCTHLPHSSKTGVPLSAIPFEEIDYCGTAWYHDYNLNRTSNSTCTVFSGAWYPSYNPKKRPPYFRIAYERVGFLCLTWTNPSSKFYAGNSTCNSSIEINDMDDNRKGKNGTYPKVASNGTYFVCGIRAYPWLPLNWTGSCYLAYVVPHMRLITGPLSKPLR